jgi:hypothetical protein
MQLPAGCYVMRRKPAAHAFRLQVGVQPLSEVLIFRGIADEAGVELDGLADEGSDVRNKVVGNAGAP